MKRFLFGVFGALLFSFLGVTDSAFAATNVSGTIVEDTLWTASSSPYIATDKITIPAGVTLTLEKGVVVKLRTRGIVVDGTIRTEGTEAEPVYFTAQTDDGVGGDSNGDGTATVPAQGAWHGIQFSAGASGSFDNTVFRYAGYSKTGVSGTPLISAIHNLGGIVTVNNSEFAYSPSCAIGQTSGEVSVSDSSTHDINCGVVVLGGEIILQNNDIGSSNTGLFVNGANTIELRNNVFSGSVTTADITLTPVTSFINEGNSASGGQFNGLIVRGVLSHDTRLTKDSMPYIVSGNGGSRGLGGFSVLTDGNLTVGSGRTLSVDAGAMLKFTETARLTVDGSLMTEGSSDELVHFTSLKDDGVGGDTNGDSSATSPARSDWNHIQFNAGSRGVLRHAVVRYGGRNVSNASFANVYNNGGDVTFESGELAFGGQYGFRHVAGTSTITQSFIHDNLQYGVLNGAQKNVSVINNYWNSSTGPKHATNLAGLGDRVSDKVLFTPWKTTLCFVNCHSSVLFLPGIQASRLYLGDGAQVSDRLWEPSGNDNVRTLALSDQGTSIVDVRTEDIIDETGIAIIGDNIYKSFIAFMDDLVGDGVINAWKPFAYDWRYDVFDIVQNGTKYRDGTMRNPVDEVIALSANSKSGKVTIIAHSNGGLLAKAITLELEARGRSDLVDKIIFIGTPHLGTPKAIGTILHGYDQEALGGIIIDDGVAREVIKNLPGAYSLLPSEKYQEVIDNSVVRFDNSQTTSGFRSMYGSVVDGASEFMNFLNGAEDPVGRSFVTTSEVNKPSVSNPTMLYNALQRHKDKLDNWVPSLETSVFQIVGTGLPTMSALEYREIEKWICPQDATDYRQCVKTKILKPHVHFTAYGDETVVSKSAGFIKNQNSRLAFVDMNKLENDRIPILGQRFKHANITEIEALQTQLKRIMVGEEIQENEYLVLSEPNFTTVYDVIEMNSPVQISTKDTEGNITGMVEVNGTLVFKSEIPDSSYFELGDTKYLIVPTSIDRTTTLLGDALGGYTLTLSQFSESGGQVIEHEVVNATTTADMVAVFTKRDGEYSTIKTDLNNDGVYEYESTVDGVLIAPEEQFSYSFLLETISTLQIKKGQKVVLLTIAKQAEQLHLKAAGENKYTKLEKLSLQVLTNTISLYKKKNILSPAQAEELINIVTFLSKNL